eukprot:Protomagalhaensia_wolfi_Nauph_80__2420@NODE_259_length_3035_cov_29_680574_g171_i1_p5_GENE_NODE_259_length_3035_cov_29_680574_g171_i1NODE_259_length_3035_cov_29_680574_g171_i1_p5_ORF_typecomplete_len116_score16_39TM_helix/PF05552_12/0_05_NODE_259_length_3035_cov_29_680574_g171_i112161563
MMKMYNKFQPSRINRVALCVFFPRWVCNSHALRRTMVEASCACAISGRCVELDLCRYLAYAGGAVTAVLILVFGWLVVEAVKFSALVQLRKMEQELIIDPDEEPHPESYEAVKLK